MFTRRQVIKLLKKAYRAGYMYGDECPISEKDRRYLEYRDLNLADLIAKIPQEPKKGVKKYAKYRK